MDYKEKLKDPRWQAKRLSIFERDGFSCVMCHEKYRQLHIHHLKYNGDPWEIEDKYLVTVCGDCHKKEHQFRDIKEAELIEFLKEKKYSWDDINNLKSALIYMDKKDIESLKFCLAFPPTKDTIMELGNNAKDYFNG